MKTINITLSERDFRKVSRFKKKIGLSWEQYILFLTDEVEKFCYNEFIENGKR